MEGNPSIPIKIDNLKHEYEGYKFEGGYGDVKKSYIPPKKFVEEITISEDGTTIINIYYKLPIEPTSTTSSVSTPTLVAYTVIHYIEKPDGTYETKEVEVKYGKPNSEIIIDKLKKDYEGYEFEGGSEDTKENPIPGKFIETITILPDGSRVINMFYNTNVTEPVESSEEEITEIPTEDDNESSDEEEVEEQSRDGSKKSGNVSLDGRCGEGKGRCKSGECCSKYGWCGRTEKHCKVELGCQTEYGKCKKSKGSKEKEDDKDSKKDEVIEIQEAPEEDDNESSEEEEDEVQSVSSNERCGEGIGICKSGECCSKYGWCGKTEKHCNIELGCQTEFGECHKYSSHSKNETINKEGKCGKGIGRCKSGECCSKYGWCGKSNRYCNVKEGCQSEFGKCHQKSRHFRVTTTVTKVKTVMSKIPGKCGKGYGSCKEGYCCSKYGWCGKSSSYCSKSKGCNSKFGKCW